MSWVALGCDGPIEPSDTKPTIASVQPLRISTTGGFPITIRGTGLTSSATVSIAGVTIPAAAKSDGTELVISSSPPRPAGSAPIVVSVGSQSASSAITFVAPSGANAPPVLSPIVTVGSRPRQPSLFADLGEVIDLSATAVDQNTTQLSYLWTVGTGNIVGTGSSVKWHLPPQLAGVPTLVNVGLAVTEEYVEAGITHRNASSTSAFLRLHDSTREIVELGFRFLDRFSQNQYSVDEVLADFSPTCDNGNGRSQEANDVIRDRGRFRRLDYSLRQEDLVTFNFGAACVWSEFAPNIRVKPADACSIFDVQWLVEYRNDTADDEFGVIPKGSRELSTGRDFVTAVLENDRWRLCHSDYKGFRVVTFPNNVQKSGKVVG